MARLKDIVIDADHPAALARFWAAALDGYAVAPYDDAEIVRLLALGASLSRRGEGYTVLRDPEGNPFCVVQA